MHACMTDWLNEWIRMDACMHACMDTWMQGWKDDFISSKYGFNLLIKDDTSKANTNYSDNYSLTTASLSIFKTYTWTQIWDILNLIEWFKRKNGLVKTATPSIQTLAGFPKS